MRKVLAALTIVAALPTSPAVAVTCLDTREIMDAHSSDGKIMTFSMRDGQTYINHLRGTCPDLRYNGFVWTIRGIEKVCENMQSLRVLESGEVCMLGKFDPPTTKTSG
jgi:hypothetical protein